jgi:hypothetical protein
MDGVIDGCIVGDTDGMIDGVIVGDDVGWEVVISVQLDP